VNKTGLTLHKLRVLLRKAGATDTKGATKFYLMDRIPIESATKVLEEAAAQASAPAQVKPPDLAGPDLAGLDAAAQKATLHLPSPLPVGLGSMNSDDPIPEALLTGEYYMKNEPFPMPSRDRRDPAYVYKGLQNQARNLDRRHDQGWRCITDERELQHLYPDGKWKRMRTDPSGRMTKDDLVLAKIPRGIWTRQKEYERRMVGTLEEANTNAVLGAVDQAKANLRRTQGPGGDRHIEPYIAVADEADARAAHAAGAGAGKSRVFQSGR
jgi:hypothetical protein